MSRKSGDDFKEFKQSARIIPDVAEYLDSFSVAVGNLVFSRRLQMGLSQQELADRTDGVTQATISRIEAGGDVKTKTLDKVFKVLKLTRIQPFYEEDAATLAKY